MNFAYPSRLHLRFALNLAGRTECEGGRENPPVEPEPSCCIVFQPTNSAEDPNYYCGRWGIEIYFRILKSGCKVEESQLQTAERFLPYLALCMVVAWRIQYLVMLGRECPDLPCDVAFDDDEWKTVYAAVKNQPPPKKPPSLKTMIGLVASLGGYLGRKGDGEPGPKVLWVGLQRMTDLVRGWRAFARHGQVQAEPVPAAEPPAGQPPG